MKQLDEVALARSTLEKPRWKRGLFIVLISTLISFYYIENALLSLCGLGKKSRKARTGGAGEGMATAPATDRGQQHHEGATVAAAG